MPAGSILFKLLVTATLLIGSLTLCIEAILGSRSRPRAQRRRVSRARPSLWSRLNRAVRVLVGPDLPSAIASVDRSSPDREGADVPDRLYKSEAEWKAQLTEEQFRVTRTGGTERPFTGAYDAHFSDGTYTCVCCGSALFSSEAKFDSGSGWPSFWKPVALEAIDEIKDISYGMVRTEVICNRCEAHLGHMFPDGPAPTGLRFCINSAALDFLADEDGISQRRID